MVVRLVLSVVGLGFLLIIGPLAFAASQHVAEAIMHARAAVLQGQQGYPDDFVKHAQEALTHAEMAKKETTNPHLDEGIKGLRDAVTDAKNGYVEDAIETVESAIEHLSEVP